MTEYLFVYGTLRPGLAPAKMQPLVGQLRPVGRGCTPGALYDLGPYPGAVFDDAAQTLVWGEVCELPADALLLKSLDEYEGYMPTAPARSLYVRVRRPVTLADGRTLECWAYSYNRNTGQCVQIPSGDYLAKQ